MQALGRATVDWEDGEEGEFIFHSSEDGAWRGLEEGF